MTKQNIKYVIVAHPARREQATALAHRTGGFLLMDYEERGANWNHHRAWQWAAEQTDRVVVIEDDAKPVAGFERLVPYWLSRFPDQLISFYLGTGRPPQYQMEIATKLVGADKVRADHIVLRRLVHGVCYSVPPALIPKVISRWDERKPADYAVGDAIGGDVIYPCYSLVDHADGLPVERPRDLAPRTERRTAWRLYGQT
ncbi:bacteriophage protein [Serratia marcescens]|nr:bacteriophage protein [Serratia marcescens]